MQNLVQEINGYIKNRAKNISNHMTRGASKLTTIVTLATILTGCPNFFIPPTIPNSPPQIYSEPLTEIEEKTSKKYQFLVDDPDDDQITASFRNAPDWVSIEQINSGEWEFSFTTPEVQSDTVYDFSVAFSDGEDTATQDWSLTVKDIPEGQEPDDKPYDVEVDFSSTDASLDEETPKTIFLPEIDAEGNPITYTSADPVDDSKFQLFDFNSKTRGLTLQGDRNIVGDYAVQVNYQDYMGQSKSTNLEGILHDMFDVSGRLETIDEHGAGVPGSVKVYNFSPVFREGFIESSEVGGYVQLINEIPVSSGLVDAQLNQRVSDLTEDIIVRARQIENEESESYTRTMKLPRGDARNLVMRVVPYVNINGDEEIGTYWHPGNSVVNEGQRSEVKDFRRHVAEVMSASLNNGTDPLTINPIIYKWDFGSDPNANYSFQRIVISRTNHPNHDYGEFSEQTAQEMKKRILDPNDIGAMFGGRIQEDQIQIFNNYNTIQEPEDYGTLFIYPDEFPVEHPGQLPAGGLTFTSSMNGYLKIAVAYIGTESDKTLHSQGVFAHETGGHGIGQDGHAETFADHLTDILGLTIMTPVVNYMTSPGILDIKTAQIQNEPSYVHGQGNIGIGTNYLGVKYVLGLTQ